MATSGEHPAAPCLLDELVARRTDVVAKLLDGIVPGYPRRRRLPEVEAGTAQAFDVIVARMADGCRLVPEDIPFVRPVVRQAALRGGSEAEILRGPLQAQRVIWQELVELAVDSDERRAAAIALAPVLMDYVDVASQLTHEAYIEIHEALNSRANVVRFELLEDLLAGRPPEPGAKLKLARGCGLVDGTAVVVVVARVVASSVDQAALPLTARALARAPGDALEPLAVVRDDEVVLVRATAPDAAQRLAGELDRARLALESDGLQLAIAVSAVHEGLAAIPLAYEEASVVLERMRERAGVLALPALGTLEYLILRADNRTAWQLIAPPVRDFVAADLADGGQLTDTLLAYVEHDLNVRRAAEQLFIHPNTAHYRLGKIEQRTGCNLRRFGELEELLLAIKLARAR